MENNVLVCEGPTEGDVTTISTQTISSLTVPRKSEQPHGHGMQKVSGRSYQTLMASHLLGLEQKRTVNSGRCL